MKANNTNSNTSIWKDNSLRTVILLLMLLLILPSVIAVVKANPVLSNPGNNVSNDTYPHLSVGQGISFNVSANETGTYNWLIDGVNQNNNNSIFNTSFSKNAHYNVSVFMSNGNGNSNLIIWTPLVLPTMSSPANERQQLNTTAYDSTLSSIENHDFQAFLSAQVTPFTGIMGEFFYLILYGLPMVVIWIRQEKVIIPVTLTLIFSVLFLGQVPASVKPVIYLFITLTFSRILYGIYKERG